MAASKLDPKLLRQFEQELYLAETLPENEALIREREQRRLREMEEHRQQTLESFQKDEAHQKHMKELARQKYEKLRDLHAYRVEQHDEAGRQQRFQEEKTRERQWLEHVKDDFRQHYQAETLRKADARQRLLQLRVEDIEDKKPFREMELAREMMAEQQRRRAVEERDHRVANYKMATHKAKTDRENHLESIAKRVTEAERRRLHERDQHEEDLYRKHTAQDNARFQSKTEEKQRRREAEVRAMLDHNLGKMEELAEARAREREAKSQQARMAIASDRRERQEMEREAREWQEHLRRYSEHNRSRFLEKHAEAEERKSQVQEELQLTEEESVQDTELLLRRKSRVLKALGATDERAGGGAATPRLESSVVHEAVADIHDAFNVRALPQFRTKRAIFKMLGMDDVPPPPSKPHASRKRKAQLPPLHPPPKITAPEQLKPPAATESQPLRLPPLVEPAGGGEGTDQKPPVTGEEEREPLRLPPIVSHPPSPIIESESPSQPLDSAESRPFQRRPFRLPPLLRLQDASDASAPAEPEAPPPPARKFLLGTRFNLPYATLPGISPLDAHSFAGSFTIG